MRGCLWDIRRENKASALIAQLHLFGSPTRDGVFVVETAVLSIATMNLLVYAVTFSSCVAVAASSGTVVFERRGSRRPCDDKSVELTITAAVGSETRYAFRLRSTDTIFSVRLSNTLLHFELTTKMFCAVERRGWYIENDIGAVCMFFLEHQEMLEDLRESPALRNVNLTLIYAFDPKTNGYTFRLYVQGRLARVCTDGVTEYETDPELSREILDAAKSFNPMRLIVILKSRRQEMIDKWGLVCTKIENLNNESDAYRIWYAPDTRTVYCSLESRVPWRRNISVYGLRSEIRRTYGQDRFLTLASAPVGGSGTSFMCTIASPDGTVAIQNLTLPANGVVPQTTLVPRGEAAAPAAENASGPSSATVTAVVVVSLLVSGIAVGLIAGRERIRRTGPGFLRLCRR